MDNQIILKVDGDIEQSQVQLIRNAFQDFALALPQFEQEYEEVLEAYEDSVTEELQDRAKSLRLQVRRIRLDTEKERKRLKRGILDFGRAIDSTASRIQDAVSDKEEKLKEIETHFERMEQERLKKLQASRVKQLSQYVEDTEERDLSGMPDDVWDAFYSTKRQQYEQRLEKERKEREAEEKRKAEELERIKQQGIELAKAKAEAEKLRQEQIAERKRQAEIEAKRKAEEEARIKEQQRKERERLHAMQLAQEAEEAKRKAEEEAQRLREEAEAKAKEEEQRKAREAQLEAEAKKLRQEQEALMRKDKGKVARIMSLLDEIKGLSFRSKANKQAKAKADALLEQIEKLFA